MPLHSGAFSVGWENPWVNVSVQGEGVSERWGSNEHYDETLIDGYFELGATLWKTFPLSSRQRQRNLHLRLDVKNLLDKQYEIVRLYPMPGFSWQFTVGVEI
jgi:outer membrane receptor protein involved in Fe transport